MTDASSFSGAAGYSTLMSSLRVKKISIAVLTVFSLLAGGLGLGLVFTADPRNFAAQEFVLSRALYRQAQDSETGGTNREQRAQLVKEARQANLAALRHDPYNAIFWVGLGALEKDKNGLNASEARQIALRLSPGLTMPRKQKDVRP